MSESSTPENAPAPESKPAPENPKIGSLNERLDGAQGSIDALRREVVRSSRITAIVVAILLLLLIGYFTVGYVNIRNFLANPQELVSLAGQTAEDYLPELRRTLEKEVERSAPEWAKQVSDEVVANAPKVREGLEDYALEQTDALIKDLSGITEKEFKKFLVESRPTLEKSIRELSSADGTSEETVQELREALDAQLQANTKEQSDELLHTLYAMKDKLERLSAGRNLNPEEAMERRALTIVRRMQLEQADPSFKGKKANIATSGGMAPVAEEPAEEPAAPEAKEEAKPKEDTPSPKAKEEAKPKDDAPAPKAKDEPKPKAETPKPEPKEEAKPKAETPKPEPKEAKPEPKPKSEPEPKPDAPKEKSE